MIGYSPPARWWRRKISKSPPAGRTAVGCCWAKESLHRSISRPSSFPESESPRASNSRSYPGRKNLLRRIERLLLRSGMSTLVDTARTAAFIDGHIVVRMEG